MILQDALCDLRETLMQTGFFNRVYEYAEILNLQEVERAVYFTSGPDFIDVHDFDVNGSGYIRKIGAVTTSELEASKQVVSCASSDPIMNLRYPLRLVAAVPKTKLENDNYSDERLATQLFTVLHRVYTPPQGVTKLSGRVTRYETSRLKVWQEEVKELAGRTMNLELSYIYLDFELLFMAKVSCLQTVCY